jgi:hypothetical protein
MILGDKPLIFEVVLSQNSHCVIDSSLLAPEPLPSPVHIEDDIAGGVDAPRARIKQHVCLGALRGTDGDHGCALIVQLLQPRSLIVDEAEASERLEKADRWLPAVVPLIRYLVVQILSRSLI